MDNKDKIFDMRTKRLTFICVVFGAIFVAISGLLQILTIKNIETALLLLPTLISVELHIILYILEESRHLKINNESQKDISDIIFNNIIQSFYITFIISIAMLFINKSFGYFDIKCYLFFVMLTVFLNFIIKDKNDGKINNSITIFMNCMAVHCFSCVIFLMIIEVPNKNELLTINKVVLTHKLNIEFDTIISIVASIITAGTVFYLEQRHTKKIERINEKCRQQKIIDDANRFIIENIDEIQWLPLCPIACMNDKHYNYHRKIYKLFNAQSDEVKLEILKIREINFPINFAGNLQDVCIDVFNTYNKTAIENDSFAKNNKKHFEMCMQNGFKTLHRMDEYQKIKEKTKNLFEKIDLKTTNKVFEEIKKQIDFDNHKVYEKVYIETEIMRLLLEKWNKENNINTPLYVPYTLEDLCLVVMAEIYVGQLQKYNAEKNK